MIIDLGGVEAGDGKSRKDLGKQIGAGLGQFVEDQRAADGLRQDRQKAGASGRFQHPVIRCDRGGCQSGKAEGDRRRKLLEVLAFLGTPGLRGQQPRDLCQHGNPCSRSCGFTEKRLSVFA